MTAAKKLRGALAYRSGLAAEDSVALQYERAGLSIVARRWRGTGGELDLVARDGNGFVFIEVKKSSTHAVAAERLSQRQISRIIDTALEYVADGPLGLATEMRFDVALVDGSGCIEILENALAA